MHLIIIGILSTLVLFLLILLIYACVQMKKGHQRNTNQKVGTNGLQERPNEENPYDEYHVYDTVKIYNI